MRNRAKLGVPLQLGFPGLMLLHGRPNSILYLITGVSSVDGYERRITAIWSRLTTHTRPSLYVTSTMRFRKAERNFANRRNCQNITRYNPSCDQMPYVWEKARIIRSAWERICVPARVVAIIHTCCLATTTERTA